MSWADSAWYDARWESVAPETRERIVSHLRTVCAPSALDELRRLIDEHGLHDWIHVPGHHGFGTNVRNTLRHVVRDDELPLAPYPEGRSHSNWDDYYVQALEAAAGARDA